MTELQVDLHGQRIGHLSGDNRAFDFQFDAHAVSRLGPGSAALSIAILAAHPLTRTHRARRQNFFTELLPEGRNREWICAQAGIAYGDVLGILTTYGRDIAGALEIWDPLGDDEPRTPSTIAVSDIDIGATLTDMASMPLGNVPGRGASSVAGVQAKMVLTHVNGAWHRPVDGYPSTHILKPVDPAGPQSIIWDEEYGARIARRLGLSHHETTIEKFANQSALVIERYDRDPATPGGRIHQEDFNQALGASGDQKYQRPGGKVSLARIAEAVRTHCGARDLGALARRTVAAVALGDLDCHAKNLSLLHHNDGSVTLAPAYDLVPQAISPDGEMALAIAGVYRHESLTRDHLVEEIASWHVRGADVLVTHTLEEILAAVEDEVPLSGARADLHEQVRAFTRALLGGRALLDR